MTPVCDFLLAVDLSQLVLLFTTKNISLYFYGDLLMFFSFRFTHVEELQF